jgi:hypothetical protein
MRLLLWYLRVATEADGFFPSHGSVTTGAFHHTVYLFGEVRISVTVNYLQHHRVFPSVLSRVLIRLNDRAKVSGRLSR